MTKNQTVEEGVERETTDDEGVVKMELWTVVEDRDRKKAEDWMKVLAWERLEVQIERTGGMHD